MTLADSKPCNFQICFIGTASPDCVGGLAAYERHTGEALIQSGCRVEAIARFRTAQPPGIDYSLSDTTGLIEGKFPTHIIAPLPQWMPLLKRLPTFLSRPTLHSLGIQIFAAAYGPAIRKAMPQHVDIVHLIGTGWEMLGFVAIREARRRGAFVTIHPAIHPGTWGDSPLDFKLYHDTDAIFAQTHSERNFLVEKGIRPERISVRGLAPAVASDGDGDRFRRQYHLGVRPLVLFIGRRTRDKGYHTLAEAISLLLPLVPDVCLVVLTSTGTPPYPDLPPGNMLLMERASDAVKADALAACDVLCVPSTAESFGIVYVEGWLYRKPVVGSTAPAVAELVTNNETGVIVQQNATEVASSLASLLQDTPLRRQLGEAGYRYQQTQFTWQAVAQHYCATFARLVESKQQNNRVP